MQHMSDYEQWISFLSQNIWINQSTNTFFRSFTYFKSSFHTVILAQSKTFI
jgi:hypothetical protein